MSAHVFAIRRVDCDAEEPAVVADAAHLREREEDLLARLVVVLALGKLAEERPEELGVLGRATLAEPPDRLFAHGRRCLGALGESTQECRAARGALFVERKDGLLAEHGIRR